MVVDLFGILVMARLPLCHDQHPNIWQGAFKYGASTGGQRTKNTEKIEKSGFSDFGFIFGLPRGVLGVGRALEMILVHMAPSSLNMSPYRAIWTHFRPNSMIFINLILQTPLTWLASGIGSRQIHDRFTIDSR